MALQRQRVFGLEEGEYEALLESQSGVCAICGERETNTYKGKIRSLAVDHCHETKRVRGLLCMNCNTLLGKAKDDPNRLIAAALYLLGQDSVRNVK